MIFGLKIDFIWMCAKEIH